MKKLFCGIIFITVLAVVGLGLGFAADEGTQQNFGPKTGEPCGTCGKASPCTTCVKPAPCAPCAKPCAKPCVKRCETPCAKPCVNCPNQAPCKKECPAPCGPKCDTFTFDATNSYDPNNSCLAYTWDLGDGTTSTEPCVTHTYAKAGEYTVTLTVKDSTGAKCDTAATTQMVKAFKPPVAAFTGPDCICIGDSVTFDASGSTATDSSKLSYNWNFGDGCTGEGKTVTHNYEKGGCYKVSLMINDNSGSACATDSICKDFKVNCPPTINLCGPIDMCIPACADYKVNLSAKAQCQTGCTAKYTWDFGDGEKGEGASVCHIYKKGGSYTATCMADDCSGSKCCTCSASIKITLNKQPVAVATGPECGCIGDTITFDGSGSTEADGDPLSYKWDFGDGTTGEGAKPTHVYQKGGCYTATLTVDDGRGTKCSSAVACTKIKINAGPTAMICPVACICEGQKVTLDASGSSDPDRDKISYAWDFGDGQKLDCGPSKVTHCYAKGGNYNASVTVNDGRGLPCSMSTASTPVKVSVPPVAAFTAPACICIGDAASFDASATTGENADKMTYSWNFGDGCTEEGKAVTHLYKKGGSYKVTLTVNDNTGSNCCTDAICKTIKVNCPPVINSCGPIDMCIPACKEYKVTLSAKAQCQTGCAAKYTWDFGDGTTGEGATVCHVYAKGGSYVAKVVADDCSGSSCSSCSSSVNITLNKQPVAVATGPEYGCIGETITFDGSASTEADGDPLSYKWDFGDGTTGEGAKPTHVYQKGGCYTATLTVDDGRGTKCSSATACTKIKINAGPAATLCPVEKVCVGDTVCLDASGSSDPDGNKISYAWDFGDGQTLDCGPAKTSHCYAKSGIYTVKVTVNDGTGTPCATASVTTPVKVQARPIAIAGPDQKACVGDTLSFDGSASSDPDGDTLTYKWSFGDGATAEGAQATHVYAKGGCYNVSLTVDDGSATHCSSSTSGLTVRIHETPSPCITVK